MNDPCKPVARQATDPFDPDAVDRRLDQLCKPPGSLGAIEALARRLCLIQQTLTPQTRPRQVTVFAADHGVVDEGVTAWPSSVTAAVAGVMQQGRTASGVWARSLECDYEVVDVGLLSPPASASGLIDAAARRGTANLMREAAMDEADFDHAWQTGASRAEAACQNGHRLLIGGEMGIGNTTSASCLIGLLELASRSGGEAVESAEALVGPGAGATPEQLDRKRRVVATAIERVEALGTRDPKRIACEVGGLEIVALAGFFATGAALRATLLIDGVIATAAALIAEAIRPGTRHAMIAGHRSSEPAHRWALSRLGLEPVLDLGMRLGEGSGALAALPLLDLAAAMITDMATLDELG